MEYIGKVALDDTFYPGEDLYCDGVIEDELLSIARDMAPLEFEKEIEKRKSWPILYHLSAKRENIVDWIPMAKADKVLEVGSGCGAITGALARKAGSVTCVDLSKKRSMINAYRHEDCDNITIHLGNYKDIEPTLPKDFDYVMLIGVFEYGQAYIGGDMPYEEFLTQLKQHVKPGGRIIIAIENKYGLKYFAGCREDHLGTFFSGIEGYPSDAYVRTFGRHGLEQIFKSCGVNQYHFYYPYPDYKFMTHLYSDGYLPKQGELFNNYRNFDRDRMLLFDETKAFNEIIKENYFDVFTNSYLAVIGPEIPVVHSKFSNDRANEYAISTKICKLPTGELVVRKFPLTEEAKGHVLSMADAYENLSQRYAGTSLAVNKCRIVEGEETYAEFEYVQGVLLSELMNQCLERNDLDGFRNLFEEYLAKISVGEELPVADFDLIFSNIIVQEDQWTIIDYEWTFGEQIETKKLAFRAIYSFLVEDEKRNNLPWDWAMELLGITPAQEQELREKEVEFQKFVNGGKASMVDMRNLIGEKMYQPTKWFAERGNAEEMNRVQIYEDCGNGFSEASSYFVENAYETDTTVSFQISVPKGLRRLRIDPSMDSCIVTIEEMTLNGVRVPLGKAFLLGSNGKCCGVEKNKNGAVKKTFFFGKKDPQLRLNLKKLPLQSENILYMKCSVNRINEDMAKAVSKRLFG